MRLKISTVITVDDEISDAEIEAIRSVYEDVAWDTTDTFTQPSIIIEKE